MAGIYEIVNGIAQQAYGSAAPQVVDTNSLVSLGNFVLSSNDTTEKFMNTLILRIGRTIISYRKYTNKLRDMVLSDFEYGAVVQKIKADMPKAIEDPTYALVEGEAVDDMKVYKEGVHQALFYTNTPYAFPLTLTRQALKEAFLSEASMQSYINARMGEVQNALEVSLENLGRQTLVNYIVNVPTREVKLVTLYNNTVSGDSAVTSTNAMYNKDFLAFAVGRIKMYMKRFTDMSTQYNDGTTTRHTPFEDQRLKIYSEFITQAETRLQAETFNEQFVRLAGYSELNFFQNAQPGNEMNVKGTNSSNTEVDVNNIVALLYDRDALGIYKMDEYVLSTPMNALGSYFNTFWHGKELWFNDLSENFIYFTLN